jgi:hypothetical protein
MMQTPKVRERLAVSKQTTHRVHLKKFNLKKLNKVEGKEPVLEGSCEYIE